MPTVIINVTQDHIDAAEYLCSDSGSNTHKMGLIECCPLALAFRTAGYPDAVVTGGSVFLSETQSVDLPVPAFHFRLAFDNKLPVQPTKLEFDLPW